MFNPIEEKRRLVQERISKSFDNGINIAEEMSLEKAHKDGDHHPTKPWVWVSSANGGKGDWRVEGGRAHKKAGASTIDARNSNKTMSSANEKTWDKLDDFNKKGSDENNLWNSWYKYQKSGDPSHISTFRNILEKKFPQVAEWNQTSPNTGKAVITAKDSDGKDIASIDLSGNEVSLTKLQTFMDKCYDISKKDASTPGNSIDSVWDDNAGGYKTEPFKGAAKVDSLKAGDKLQTKSGKIYTVKSVNNNANNTVDIVMDNSSKIGGGVHVQTYNKSGYIGAKKVEAKKDLSNNSSAYAQRVLGLMQIQNSKYKDISKVKATKTDKGNWVMSYDGKDTGLIIGKDHLSESELKKLGVFELYQGNKNKSLSPQEKVKDIMRQFDDTTMDEDEFDEYVDSVLGNDTGQKLRKEILNGNKSFSDKKQAYKDAVERHLGLKPQNKKKQPKKSDSRDKIAQDAGFKDYEEMKGHQDYVTMKNLLKKPSTKAGMRLLYQQEVTKYEKDHADLIKRIGNK